MRTAPRIDETERFRGIVGPERPQGAAAVATAERFHGIGERVPETAEKDGFRGIVARLTPDPEVKIDANTSRCKWLGERMDYSLVIEAMQFREINAAAATATAAVGAPSPAAPS